MHLDEYDTLAGGISRPHEQRKSDRFGLWLLHALDFGILYSLHFRCKSRVVVQDWHIDVLRLRLLLGRNMSMRCNRSFRANGRNRLLCLSLSRSLSLFGAVREHP